jgi:hypothetical protein
MSYEPRPRGDDERDETEEQGDEFAMRCSEGMRYLARNKVDEKVIAQLARILSGDAPIDRQAAMDRLPVALRSRLQTRQVRNRPKVGRHIGIA